MTLKLSDTAGAPCASKVPSTLAKINANPRLLGELPRPSGACVVAARARAQTPGRLPFARVLSRRIRAPKHTNYTNAREMEYR
jgi:hypothetical protein